MDIVKEVEQKITPLVEAEHMELVDVQYVPEQGKKVLRIFLDKEGGVHLADCEKMSRLIGAFLDQTDLVPESFVLEVSSPGLDRVLKKEKDFVRFIGHKAKITVYAPIDGQRNFIGNILEAGNNSVTVDDATGKKVSLSLDIIAKAHLEPELD
jgi:ribosome maturation factor RimP